PTGMPCSGPSQMPSERSRSASCASRSARSAVRLRQAPYVLAAARRRHSLASSTAVSSPSLSAALSSSTFRSAADSLPVLVICQGYLGTGRLPAGFCPCTAPAAGCKVLPSLQSKGEAHDDASAGRAVHHRLRGG